jgi:hypothetical protein
MYDFVLANWCFVPYLAILLFLTVMSIREGKGVKRARPGSSSGKLGWDHVDGLLAGACGRDLYRGSSRRVWARSGIVRAEEERPRS